MEHRDSLQAMLATEVVPCRWLPDSYTLQRQKHGPSGAGRSKILDSLFGTRDRGYLDSALKALDESESTVVVAYWGTRPLADILAIKKARPRLKVVLMALCHPLGFTSLGIFRQRLRMTRAGSSLDGVICPSMQLRAYLQQNDLRGFGLPMLELAPCWPSSCQAPQRAPAASEWPNLVFVGRTDIRGASATGADDLRPLMAELFGAGVRIHHTQSPDMDDGHPLRRPFSYLATPQLISFMGGFDASLVAYNAAACKRRERLMLTVPDRLITTVAAGIPVAIPRDGYPASKAYLSQYPAVIEFGSASELGGLLRDRVHMRDLAEAAWQARCHYTAQARAAPLIRFLEGILDGHGASARTGGAFARDGGENPDIRIPPAEPGT